MNRIHVRYIAAALLGLGLFSSPVFSGEPTRPVETLRDNSFLIEEAYNQEPGVVQHIVTMLYQNDRRAGPNDSAWELAFTQEWPVFSQTHQFSYSIPYHMARSGGRSTSGLGDVSLTYRYEAYFDEPSLTAFAPAFSVILPTGDKRKGFSEDTLGYDLTLPFSTTVGDRWFVHLNAGTTYLPDAASANRDLWHFNLGASAIYAATSDLHFLVEWIGNWDETPRASGGLRHEFSSLIMPGARKAFNFSNGAQLVAGAGVPLGLTSSTPEIGAFLYFSFEHTFRRNP